MGTATHDDHLAAAASLNPPRKSFLQMKRDSATEQVRQGNSLSQAILSFFFDDGSAGQSEANKAKEKDCKNSNGNGGGNGKGNG